MDYTASTSILPITNLRPHPLNQKVYEELSTDSDQYLQLLTSIREHGVLQPLMVRPDGTILSGHRRLKVALAIGLESLPCIVRDDGDDRVLIVENNRYRHKTASELMREAELLVEVEREKAKARMGKPDPNEPKYEVRDIVAGAIGMGSRTFGKLEQIYKASKFNANAKEKLDRIDKGEVSIDAAYKSLKVIIEEPDDTPETAEDIPDFIRFFNSWQFSGNDPRFGIPHPGRIPGQISANIIYYYTERDDLVVDPMAGGGSTLDAATFLGRRCLAYDVVPKRPDITQHDISTGFPEEAQGCQLIFMDPPYWNVKDEAYSDASSSRKSLSAFIEWYHAVLCSAARTVRLGGFVATINMAQYFRLPADFSDGYIDWPVRTYQTLESAGMRPWSRIAVGFPTSLHADFDVANAKKGRFFLPNLGDIIVMRRMR